MDESTRYSLLLDRYGALLTEKQENVARQYHDENLSLSEIAEELEISRQGVHDALKKAQSALDEYEQKLGLVQQDSVNEKLIREIRDLIGKARTAGKAEEEIILTAAEQKLAGLSR